MLFKCGHGQQQVTHRITVNKIKDVPATSFFPVQGNVTKKTEHERKERFMTRRELREQIFKLLFGVEFHDRQELPEQIAVYEETEEPWDAKDGAYISGKCEDIVAHLAEIDEAIDAVAEGWKTGRMGKVDLTLIRLAVYEMKYDEDVPVGVAINEAVELAKKYGTDESPAFINGVLAKLV